MNVRLLNLSGAAACGGLMGYALYAQHALGLEPCPLCIFQRVAVVMLGVMFLLAAVHAARGAGRRVYAVLLGLTALGGAAVAGRHVWLTTLPPERVPSCGPGLDFLLDSFPMVEVLQLVLSGSGECAQVDWQMLGMSMPAWVLVALLALGGIGAGANWRAGRHPA